MMPEWRRFFACSRTPTERWPPASIGSPRSLEDFVDSFGWTRRSARWLILGEGLDSCLSLLQGQTPDGVDIVREYAEVGPLYCSPGRLNQAFTVLLTNAAQVMPDGGSITVRLFDEGHEVCVQVTDDGPGIPAERLEHIFEVGFSATDDRVKMSYGLPTTYAIVHKHDGHIDIDSSVGEGTTVTIRLPRKAELPEENGSDG